MGELLDEVIDSINKEEKFCIDYIKDTFLIILKREGFEDIGSKSIIDNNKKMIVNCFNAIKDILNKHEQEDFDIPNFD